MPDLDFKTDPFKHYQGLKDYLDGEFNRLSEKYKMKPVEIDKRLCRNPKFKLSYTEAKQLYVGLKPENDGDIYESWLFQDMKQTDYIEFVKKTKNCRQLFESVFGKID